ncbi:hypothetical protein [Arthrobacter sp. U41]|uniref:hypothetical protein n=1 Tax=Arthrobacter sp. U41 TaxID=1849032 RepID=UPI0008592DF6|nr:hypothetical protein [Arthrobacter sp. U41]AOT04311.1 hypothetical protein ASPU41_14280 [Arthrobacter sp. U41]
MTITAPRRDRRHLRESVPARPPSLPSCRHCGTDAYLEFSGYVPASYAPDRDSLRPPVVSYGCKHCGKHYSHHAPEDWAPPGWQWYA